MLVGIANIDRMRSRNHDSYQNNNHQYSYEFTITHFYILHIISVPRVHKSIQITTTKAMSAILMMNITLIYVFLPVSSRFARMPSLMNKIIDTITNTNRAIRKAATENVQIKNIDNLPLNLI